MDSLITFLNKTGETFVDFSTPMLIQSSVLIIVLLALDMLLRKKVRAVFRYCIWMLVLVKLVLPTTLSSPTGLGYWFGDQFAGIVNKEPSPAEKTPPVVPGIKPASETVPLETAITPLPPTGPAYEPAAKIPEESAVSTPPATASLSWHGFVFLGWLAVVTAMALLLIQRMFFVRGLLAQSKPPSDSMISSFQQCRKQMKIRGKANLKLSPVAASPSVCGLFRPTILIPQNLPSKLNREDLRSILLHELAHIKRGDLPVSLIQTILQIAYFYNPLLWAANAIIRKVREQAVDEMVLVAMGEQAEDYPETLLNISRLTFSRPVLSLRLIGVVESKKALSGRIKHILSRPFPKTAKLGFLGLIAVIITASILLPMAKTERENIDVITKMEGLVGYWSFDGNANDKTGNRHGVVHEATLAKGISGQCYYFGGGDDYISLGEMSLEKFSISAWVKSEKRSINNHRVFLLDDGQNYYAFQGNSRGGVGVYITGDIEINEYDKIIAKDEWTHLTVTFDGKTVKIYWNGELSEARQANFTEGITGKAYIGFSGSTPGDNRHDGDYCWNGFIDDVAIYNKALSAGEIQNIYRKFANSINTNSTENFSVPPVQLRAGQF